MREPQHTTVSKNLCGPLRISAISALNVFSNAEIASEDPRLFVKIRGFCSSDENHLRRKVHLVMRKEFFDFPLHFTCYLRLLASREVGELLTQRIGRQRTHGPKLVRRERGLDIKL